MSKFWSKHSLSSLCCDLEQNSLSRNLDREWGKSAASLQPKIVNRQ
jgi:hypothetical protein